MPPSSECHLLNGKTGLFTTSHYFPSPNCDARNGAHVDLLVIHNISLPPGKFDGDDIIKLFLNELDLDSHPSYRPSLENLKVSAHLFIRRDGKLIQFVPLHMRAWHAGESFFQGRAHCNDFSIGIELEGTDEIPYTKSQYHQLITVVREIKKFYPRITDDRIVGHQTIAPHRKTDPGPSFDWEYFFKLL